MEAEAPVLAGAGVLAAGYKVIETVKDIIDGGDGPQLPGMAPGPEDLLGPRVNATPAHRADLGAGVESFPAQDPQRPQIMGTPVTQERPTILSTPVDTGVRATVFLNDGGSGDRKTNPSKGESSIWKDLKPYRGGIKTNGESGSKTRFYEWDHLHNDIEVYGPKGDTHLGSMDPISGEIYKPGNPRYTLKGRI